MGKSIKPVVYEEDEIDCIERHIEKHFGAFEHVFHEIASTGIHVDICIIPPGETRPFYTLVTMGMGAHKMTLPDNLKDSGLARAELVVTLPPDWKLDDSDEKWYWPIRWLKVLARLPVDMDTWLGWGHTVPNGESFAENTALSNVLLIDPYPGEASMICLLPNGETVNFYQMFPLYDEETDFKRQHDTQKLLSLFGSEVTHVLDINRRNYGNDVSPAKKFAITEIRPLIEWGGAEGCFATDRIMVDGSRVGFMYREKPEYEGDSGWRFAAGDETAEYMDEPDNSGIYMLNTVANYDPDIIDHLKADYGSAFFRNEKGEFERDEDWEDEGET
ncbi:DUF2185 domain-containing protein [Oxalobacter sp. OttesenSCG-928-P03]|nr:DUF2185 domain-containing protein [Oxalobacter sp. OttesenSCG-928-P03]